MTGYEFYDTLMNLMASYLSGAMTDEAFYTASEAFYSRYAKVFDHPEFHRYYLGTVADACLFYLDEPGLAPDERDRLLRQTVETAYTELRSDVYAPDRE